MKAEICAGAGLFQRVRQDVRRVISNPDFEAIHKLRITLRRCEAWQRLYENRFQRADWKHLRDSLEQGLNLAGAVRDYDVSEKLLHKFGCRKFDMKLHADRVEKQSKLVAFLIARGKFICPPLLPKCESASLSKIGLPRYIRLGDRIAKKGSTGRELHRFRMAAKEVRYMLEFVELELTSEWLEKVEDVQQLLGSVNDCRVARRVLKGLGSDERVRKKLKARQKGTIEEFRKHWPGLRFDPYFK